MIPNDKLLEVSGNSTSLTDAFSLADDVLRQGVQVGRKSGHVTQHTAGFCTWDTKQVSSGRVTVSCCCVAALQCSRSACSRNAPV